MINFESLSKKELIDYIQEREKFIVELSKEKYFSELKYETNVLDEVHLIESTLFLKGVYEKGSYKSLRQFSYKIQIAPGKISEIFSGKRYLTRTLLEKIQYSEELSFEAFEKLKKMVNKEVLERKRIKSELKKTIESKTEPVKQLEGESFCYMDDWSFYAILALLEREEKDQSVKWISENLNLSIQQVKRSLKVLLSLQLIIKKENRYYLASMSNTFNTNKPIEAQKALKKLTNSILEKSKDVYNQMNFPMNHQADYINFSLLADPHRIPTANKMLANYLYKICEYLSNGEEKEVYYLNAQLFPVLPK